MNNIKKLKREKNACILAHYYVDSQVQEVADYVGDSFYLARLAQRLENPVVIIAGVYFMAESIKILNPEKKVFMLDNGADCPMAHMITPDKIETMRKKYEDLAVVTYINSTAEIKAYSDVCVTSSNAVKIVKKLPEKNIFFIPDKNLGSYVADHVPEKNIILNQGFCPVHDHVIKQHVDEIIDKKNRPVVMVHPECRREIIKMADYVGSTKGIIENVENFSADSPYLILTEKGIGSELEKRFPNREFNFLQDFICPDMKLCNMKKLEKVLKGEGKEIVVDSEIAERAKVPLRRMLELGD